MSVPRRPVRVAVALVLVAWGVVGCGEGGGDDPAPHPEARATDSAVRVVETADADLVLHVSNQSFEDEQVRLTVTVDGVTVVDADFHVEDQHHWVTFPLAMPSGEHEITAESDSGATLSEAFDVDGRPRYAVVEHWTEDGSPTITWLFRRRPVHFS